MTDPIRTLAADLRDVEAYAALLGALDALVADLKALPAVTASIVPGYVEYVVAQADVWRVADRLTELAKHRETR